MTAPKAFGADASFTPPPLAWKTIDWSRVRQKVRRLQMRIAKATPIAETLADRYSYGFREGRRGADALERCFNILSRRVCAQWILEGDIRACFDEISHQWLLQHVPMDKLMLRAWLKAGYTANPYDPSYTEYFHK